MKPMKNLLESFGGEFLKVNIEHSPNLETVEGCGDYIGILLNGNSIDTVNQKAKWIRSESNLLVGWETDYYDEVPENLNLENLSLIRIGGKIFEVQLADEHDNSIYGLVQLN